MFFSIHIAWLARGMLRGAQLGAPGEQPCWQQTADGMLVSSAAPMATGFTLAVKTGCCNTQH